MIGRTGCRHISYQSIHGSNIDDSAVICFEHFLGEFPRANKRSEKIDLQFVVELIVRNIHGRRHCTRTGIVDENIHAAKFLHRGGDKRFHFFRIGNIAGIRQNLYAVFLFDFLFIFFQKILPARHKHEICPLACKSFCHLYAQPGGRPRNDGNLSRQIKIIHKFLLRQIAVCIIISLFFVKSNIRNGSFLKKKNFFRPFPHLEKTPVLNA